MKKVSQAGILVKWLFENHMKLAERMRFTQCHVYDSHEVGKCIVYPNRWHLEEDVWSHTMMVLMNVEQFLISEGVEFTGKFCENTKVLLAALLHDIGKSETMHINSDKHRINFMGHHAAGTLMAIDILHSYFGNKDNYPSSEPYDEHMIDILNLIAWHDHVNSLGLSHESAETNKTLLMSGLLNTGAIRRLLVLARADMLGAVRVERNTAVIQAIDELLPELLDVSVQSQDFTFPHTMPVCEMLVGFPGSGKTTYRGKSDIKNVVSFDDIVMTKCPGMTYNEAFDMVNKKEVDKEVNAKITQFVDSSTSFLIDMTNLNEKVRLEKFRRVGNEYFKLVTVFLPGYSTLLKRIGSRPGKKIPEVTLKHMFANFQMPFPVSTDYHKVQYVIN